MRSTPILVAWLALAGTAAAQEIDLVVGAAGAGLGAELDGPAAIDRAADGSLWIGASQSANLLRVNAGGAIEEVLATWPWIDAVAGLVMAPDGTLYLSSYTSDTVIRVSTDGHLDLVVPKIGAGPGDGLDAPLELALGGDGSLYVAGRESSNVLRLDPSGFVTQIVGPEGAGPGAPLSGARAVIVDGLGTVFVAGLLSDNVLAIDGGGAISEVIGPAGDGAGHACDGPSSFAFGPDGSLYVASKFKHCVLKREPGGALSAVIDASGDGQGHALVFPNDLAFAPDGTLYVAGWGSHNVFAIAPDGAIMQVADATGDGTGNPVDRPSDLVVDSQGTVYFACAESDRVFRIDGGGVSLVAEVAGYGSPAVGIGDGALVLDGDERLLVGVWESDVVLRCEPGGGTTVLVDADADPNADFEAPDDIAVDGQGHAYVACADRVLRVDLDGTHETVIGPEGDGAGHPLSDATDVLLDGQGRLFVAGRLSNNVLRLDPDGTITEVVAPQASSHASGLALGNDGTLYVNGGSRVFTLSGHGVLTEILDKQDLYPGAGPGSVGNFTGMDVDPLGRVVVSTFEFGDVVRLYPDGTLELLWSQSGNEDPRSVVVDDGGTVYFGTDYNLEDQLLRVAPSGATTVLLGPEGDGEGHTFDDLDSLVVSDPGRLDVAAYGSDTVFSIDLELCGAFTLLPTALPGNGSGPVLTGEGSLCTADPWLLRITRGRPLTMASLVIGLAALNQPFKGGTMVPFPNLIIPVLLDGQGSATLSGLWPSLPPGANLWMQAWISDPTGPVGFKATNGLHIALE